MAQLWLSPSGLGGMMLMTLGVVIGAIAIGISFFIPKIVEKVLSLVVAEDIQTIYHKVTEPYQFWLRITTLLITIDIITLLLPTPDWIKWIERPLGLGIGILVITLGIQIFQRLFDGYLLDIALQSTRKVNSEVLIITKWSVSTIIVVAVVVIFAQTHQINIFGLIASLGIGGLAIAFAAQKTLEQILGGIVIYWDRPFVVDDYIGLPDGTFGKVESIGLRSTKIRTSGKGTLVIVPNSSLTQTNIENYTGAKKVISVIYLTFYREIPMDEKALIRQVILESTGDIFGIDARSTQVSFRKLHSEEETVVTQAQINFFILGSGEVSMDLRQQLLEIANHNITKQLKEYGIAFDIDEKTINVDSPITI